MPERIELKEDKATTDVPNAPPGTVVVVSAILTDNGDADRWADTNETVNMHIKVYNRTGIDLIGVSAQLSTNDPKIACISNPVIDIGNLADREMIVTAEPFIFMVADVGRTSPEEDFSGTFFVEMTAENFELLGAVGEITLDLDLDASGGAGPTTFFEGFEGGFGSFTTMHLDEELNPPDGDLHNIEAGRLSADGYRCQYSDPDFENTLASGNPDNPCYPNPVGLPDAFYFDVATDRAFSGTSAMYYGVILDEALGLTSPTGQLEAVRTTDPINLAWQNVCAETRSTICGSDLDCPIGEDCIAANPTLLFKHQISLLDHRAVSAGSRRTVDRAVVHLQLANDAGSPTGDWIKLRPHFNVYDSEGSFHFSSCYFDPIDDGNTEEAFFDPADPQRLFGPSSTCFPERSFADQGDTFSLFNPDDVGDASDGPGLEGSTGIGTWVETAFDLSRFRGRRVRIRYLATGIKLIEQRTWEDAFAFNPNPRDDGWFIDDVMVTDTLTEAATVSVDTKDNTNIKQDWDFDGIGAVCDCAPDDETTWDTPGEVTDLLLSHTEGVAGTTTLTWTPPADFGGTVVDYDTVGASSASDFVAFGFCVESSDGSDTIAIDSTTPDPGVVHYFLVRAEHGCGAGPLGTKSSGEPRTGLSCPQGS